MAGSPEGFSWGCSGNMGYPHGCLTPPRLPSLSNPVLGFHVQGHKVQSRLGVCPIWEPQDYISAFGHDVVLLPSSIDELQHTLERFVAEYEAAEMRILMVLCQKTMGCLL